MVEDRLDSLQVHRFLTRAGYKLVKRNGSNNWYVPAASVFPVAAGMRLKMLRKLYLSMPFRWLRSASRRMRGRTP